MHLPKKRWLFPIAGLVVVSGALFALSQFGVVTLPGSASAKDAAADSTAAADRDDKKDHDGEEKEVPVPVELATASFRPLAAYYRASSVLEADRHVELVAKVQGRVRKVLVEEGQWVREGQVLAELENDRERVQLKQAELKLEEQERELERRGQLRDKSLITEEEFLVSQGKHDLASTDRDLAAIALDDTVIRAPFDGQVTQRTIVPGQHVLASAPLFTLVDFEPLRVRIHLPEAIARRVSPGDEVFVSADAMEESIPAVVERVAPVVDPATSTVRLTLLVNGARGDALVGGFVKVRVTTDTKSEALAIPKIALVEEGGLRSVFVARGDSTIKTEVTTGLSDETSVEILDGLEAGDFVVTMGQGGLHAGSKLTVLNAEAVGWTPPPVDSTKTELASADEDEEKKPAKKRR
jgi:membrane fusion protein (multidrug efflux system)